MANVSCYSDILIVDMVGGLLTGAVVECLGGVLFILHKLALKFCFVSQKFWLNIKTLWMSQKKKLKYFKHDHETEADALLLFYFVSVSKCQT